MIWIDEDKLADVVLELIESAKKSGSKSRWVSVDDRLPTIEDGEVLAWLEGGGCFIEYIKPEEDDQTGYTPEQFKATFSHWMPSPEPPESESK